MLVWKDDYMLGVPQIDEQHKKLFEIAGKVFSLLRDKVQFDKYDKIVELIEELKDYTVYHFESEEEYMRSIGYQKYFAHKAEHNHFIDRINGVDLNVIDENQNLYLLEMMDFVATWISKHILEKDRLIAG